jgi:uncharacterized membrane protein
MKNLIKQTFTQEDLTAISAEIEKSSKTSMAEIRVSIRQNRSRGEKKLSVEEVARREYQKLGMNKNKEQQGVLILLMLKDREFFVLADDVTHRRTGDGLWTKAAGELSSQLSRKNFKQGIIQCVQVIGQGLSQSFPRK